ncbi:MAG: pyrroline-5-carboxylate reductase [Planctomycetes bacterium]|nr:pyrroline-5-carboxylate reductase [Planctomycetota bacterium]
MSYELGFLGAGNMAEAIAKAAIGKGVLKAGQMIAADPVETRRKVFADLGVRIAADNGEVIRGSKQVLLAVKPQTFPQLAQELARDLTADHVLVTIMAGITTAKITSAVAAAGGKTGSPRIIRVMPNTPLMVGVGMAGVALGPGAKPGDESLALRLFSAGGEAIVVPEEKLDAITAVSGSGPAYVFYLAEAMEKAARELGLEREASLLVRQTILGAAHLLKEAANEAPAELRRKVTSPGGTTEAAIKHMDGNKSIDVIVNAVKAAEKRSKELGA